MTSPHDAHYHGHGTSTPASSPSAQAAASNVLATLTVPTGRLACDACVTCVEDRLRENPHVTVVQVDTKHEVAHVTVHEGMVTAEELAETVAAACGDRNVVPLPKPQVSSHAHVHTTAAPGVDGHAGHLTAPSAATGAHGGHVAAAEVDHAAMGHAAPDGHAAMGHGGHGAHGGHDMSDPRMAAAMEADMRRRFWISLVLAIPVVLYSPLATNIAGLYLPTPSGI